MCLISMLLIFVLIVLVILKIYTRLTVGKCYCNVYLNAKTALVTGGNSGLGYQTALALAGRGCRVIIADKDDCEKAKESIITQTGNPNVVTKKFNLASLKSVRELAKDINETEERLDFLLNNAGIYGTGKDYTEDGLVKGMQVNFFEPFLLTHLLIGLLRKSSPSKIIFISSLVAFLNNLSVDNLNYPQRKKSDTRIFANSKLCCIIAANELTKRLSGTNVTAYALHPGVIYTLMAKGYVHNSPVLDVIQKLLYKMFLQPFARSPEEGIQTTLHLVLCKQSIKDAGKFFVECKPFIPPAKAENLSFAKQIWDASETYVKLNSDEII